MQITVRSFAKIVFEILKDRLPADAEVSGCVNRKLKRICEEDLRKAFEYGQAELTGMGTIAIKCTGGWGINVTAYVTLTDLGNIDIRITHNSMERTTVQTRAFINLLTRVTACMEDLQARLADRSVVPNPEEDRSEDAVDPVYDKNFLPLEKGQILVSSTGEWYRADDGGTNPRMIGGQGGTKFLSEILESGVLLRRPFV